MTGRRRWLAVLGLSAGLLLAAPAQAAEVTRAGRVANTNGDPLRMRAAPDPSAPIVKRLGPDWRVTIVGAPSPDGRWLRVEHTGQTGYVAVGYIALVDVEEAAPAAGGTPRPGRVATTDGLNLRLRAAPSGEAAIIKRLGPGWQVTIVDGPVTDEAGAAWLKIEHTGTLGWAAAAYIAAAD